MHYKKMYNITINATCPLALIVWGLVDLNCLQCVAVLC